VVALAILAGCSRNSSTSPRYQRPGPDPVGVTTLDLGWAGPVFGERLATVYYPADPSTLAGYPKFSYAEASTLPKSIQGILPVKLNTTTTVDAYSSVPASKSGPYPIVLFSHGTGAERLYYSELLSGIASWGYVVVSADYLERGVAAQVLGTKTKPTPAFDSSIMQSSLTALERASSQADSVLHGVADPRRVAAVGHSAGGQTALDALDSSAVTTAIGWAPAAPVGTPSKKPVMLIGAVGDQVIPPDSLKRTYDSFRGPKALVEISGEGHATYTDTCVEIRAGGGLINYAMSHHLVTPSSAKIAINGCEKSDIAPQRFWPIVQYYTVFQLKNQFDGRSRRTIPMPTQSQFPGFTVVLQQSH
jgi:dienelactone hydrolase